ncbi:MAG TPA: HXXEE domain-containing protein [Usitatibacter sp.]|nr:HXXEE domain-containing protein [Usitatibacter sp.]
MTTFGMAWLAATIALALHVADEASHDFLSFYNAQALRIRRALGNAVPFPPTFTFVPWLAGLIGGIALLAILTPWAFAGSPWTRPLACFLAVLHVANGLGHVIGSLVTKRILPGALSAPLLILSGAWLGHATAALE